MSDDPALRVALARTAYATAVAQRDATRPGDPGYHDAVLAVGLRWSQLRFWERRLATQTGTTATPSPSPSAAGTAPPSRDPRRVPPFP